MPYKLEEAMAAVTGSRGNITKIADNLGADRNTIYNLKRKWSSLDAAIKAEKERFKDLVETTIEDQILDGNTTMAIFYAKTQMKDRGYIERQEISGPDGESIPVKVIKGVSLDDL